MAQGVTVYYALGDALRDGFAVYDRTSTGYLVRRKKGEHWELGIVSLAFERKLPSDYESAPRLNVREA